MRIDQIPLKGRAGLLITIAVVIIFLIALPQARWFLAISLGLGIVVAAILRLARRG